MRVIPYHPKPGRATTTSRHPTTTPHRKRGPPDRTWPGRTTHHKARRTNQPLPDARDSGPVLDQGVQPQQDVPEPTDLHRKRGLRTEPRQGGQPTTKRGEP